MTLRAALTNEPRGGTPFKTLVTGASAFRAIYGQRLLCGSPPSRWRTAASQGVSSRFVGGVALTLETRRAFPADTYKPINRHTGYSAVMNVIRLPASLGAVPRFPVTLP